MTHLHFDHSGGTTRRTASGGFEPLFRKARHVVQRREWEDATHPHERNRASYLQENVGPLGEAGLLQLVDGETEIAPGVRVIPTPGHTAGHQSILIGPPDGPKALFLGDAVPTAVHVRLPWVMAYDLGSGAQRRDQALALHARAGRGLAARLGPRPRPRRRPPGRRQGRRLRGPRAGRHLRPRARSPRLPQRDHGVAAATRSALRCASRKRAQSMALVLPRATGDAENGPRLVVDWIVDAVPWSVAVTGRRRSTSFRCGTRCAPIRRSSLRSTIRRGSDWPRGSRPPSRMTPPPTRSPIARRPRARSRRWTRPACAGPRTHWWWGRSVAALAARSPWASGARTPLPQLEGAGGDDHRGARGSAL